jgi:hypothetical protein
LGHVDKLAKTILGIGRGEGLHEGRLAELANSVKRVERFSALSTDFNTRVG